MQQLPVAFGLCRILTLIALMHHLHNAPTSGPNLLRIDEVMDQPGATAASSMVCHVTLTQHAGATTHDVVLPWHNNGSDAILHQLVLGNQSVQVSSESHFILKGVSWAKRKMRPVCRSLHGLSMSF
jgi:hypothetical protein